MKNFRDLINESGAGLWGTDKARAKLQKDTPGQNIKSLVKDKEVSEAADPKGTIKVVKQDKVRYITKDELNTYRQMGWKQVEKQADKHDRDYERSLKAKVPYRGNSRPKPKTAKDHDDEYERTLRMSEDVKNPYTRYDSQKLQQLKKKMRDNVANLTQRVRMRNTLSGNASQSMKDELKDLERKSKLIDLALRNSSKQSDAKRAGVGSDKETFRDRQARLGKPQTEEVVEAKERIKVSFKFNSIADSAKAERKANQMKKLTVSSEKIEGKNLWLVHVAGEYADVIKYLRRNDLGSNIRQTVKEGSFYGRDDLVKQFATPKKDRHKFIKLRKTDSKGTHGVSMARKGNEDKIKDYLKKGYKEVPVESVDEGREIYIVKKGAYTRKVDGTTADRMKKDGWSIAGRETVSEGSESWEAGYKRRVVKTTKPEHKDKGYNWRIKGKDKAHLTIKLYKDKPSQAEFNKQMKRVAGHEFGG